MRGGARSSQHASSPRRSASSRLAGVFFFTVLAPEEAVWLGPLVDVPVVFLVVDAVLLLLLLLARRRIGVGRDRSAARVAA